MPIVLGFDLFHPAPPPNHPKRTDNIGWLGGGAGWSRSKPNWLVITGRSSADGTVGQNQDFTASTASPGMIDGVFDLVDGVGCFDLDMEIAG